MTSNAHIDLKALRDTIEAPLHSTTRVQDYCAYAEDIFRVLSTLPEGEEKNFLLTAFDTIKNAADPHAIRNGTAHDHIIDLSTAAAETLLGK